ncbi:G patch domain-containing protein TGH isoform X2 [Punica granatum]|uniref:G patch domain-containing protein TGH isoform X2 n=2 Tax=Punica granatum TaxID=22663 RepID=A0A218XZU2_PUNGR|nr:G patch domain-containing protein TGH isoform X2 [Punica granatum]OWM90328.1 hypothetical protein CDL15_Pgr014630 [Punica granatum]
MDSDEEDFVFYGTPVEREEGIASRKKKAIAESSGNLRSLPSWKQEVRDEEGRRRFHGAFTGGFSAGYYNTAGSKEGWTPQSFTSSRKNRAEVKQQNILNFLDEDEKAELEGRSLAASSQFDTFGFTAAELARKQAEKEQQSRPSAIPGPVPDEIVLPATDSVGMNLLKKMGWRYGHSLKDSHSSSLYEARREARKAFLAFTSDEAKPELSTSEPTEDGLENLLEQPSESETKPSKSTPVYVLDPKQDLHGLGYDPYKDAPEFREKKRQHTSGGREHGQRRPFSSRDNLFGFKSKNMAPGFGIGALEELDAEDEDVYGSGYDFEETLIEEAEEPSKVGIEVQDSRPRLTGKEHGILPGFRLASNSDYQLERFDPPVIPKDFEPRHKFPGPLESNSRLSDPPPLEVPPPEDSNLKVLIEGVATLVARCGKLFEDLSREKNQSNQLYSFLIGGNFHDYYVRKLWEERQKSNQTKLSLEGKESSVPRMTAESRGRILGERPLERSMVTPTSTDAPADVKFPTNLVDTFTKSEVFSELLEVSKPFKDNPAKQERFEQFLKEKYRGGLRSTDSGGASYMSESARARERLDFEAAAEAIEKARLAKESTPFSQRFTEFSAGGMQFTSAGVEEVKPIQTEELTKKIVPKREEFQWRPSPILCKRFDLIDPYMGKPPPAPRIRSKLDSLFFVPDSFKASGTEEKVTSRRDASTVPQSDNQESKNVVEEEPEVHVEIENVERPVDLYKAIFYDDSEDEGEISVANTLENPEKKVEAANATLNRLIAGDFLESLGKELGLEVPPELPPATKQAKNASQKEVGHDNKNNFSDPKLTQEGVLLEIKEPVHTLARGGEKPASNDSPEKRSGDLNMNLVPPNENTVRNSSNRHEEKLDSSSSEDERSRRGSRRHHYSSESDSDSSRERHYSSSKRRKRGSSREREKRSSRRKHSKRRKHRDKDSPERSQYRSERERGESKRDNRR